MGWFKQFIKNFFPIDWITGGAISNAVEPKKKEAAPAPVAPVETPIDPQLAADKLEQQKKLARVGKYFTSPTGVLSDPSSDKKIFS